jgi:Holliday junction DNA helicase RuvA
MSALLAKSPGIGKEDRRAPGGRAPLEGRRRHHFRPPGSRPASPPPGPPGDRRIRDAVLALAALGYKTAEADETVRHAALALGPAATTEQLIKKALGR